VFRIPTATLFRAFAVGAMLAFQSFFLYSAVARVPVAMALLVFHLFPVLLALLTWAVDGVRPSARTAASMPSALIGLALALDLVGGRAHLTARWKQMGAGVTCALVASVFYAAALYCTGRWLSKVDGGARSFYAMSLTTVLVSVPGTIGRQFRFPVDAVGWLALTMAVALYGTGILLLLTTTAAIACVEQCCRAQR
jgi:drug/metabolite transporter (DMT)-like permease